MKSLYMNKYKYIYIYTNLDVVQTRLLAGFSSRKPNYLLLNTQENKSNINCALYMFKLE